MWYAWIVALLGIWMVIASFVNMSVVGAQWNDWAVGVIVGILGFMMTGGETWQRVLACVVGIWLFVSGFIPGLRVGAGLTTNDVAMGILLIVAGFASMHHPHHMEIAQGAH